MSLNISGLLGGDDHSHDTQESSSDSDQVQLWKVSLLQEQELQVSSSQNMIIIMYNNYY